MAAFDDRERAFEQKFKLDEELKFKASSRAAHLLGVWAAHELGLAETEVENYALSFIDDVIAHSGHEHIIAKIEKDLHDRGINHSHYLIERQFDDAMGVALSQVMGQG
ncbi:MAG: DUF1476 domain-containing protein [Alphaproteobacteria bacterium]|nr:DUF1476 domain-containing protein [Alphaproteobacteria bacterium]MBV8548590.1 DUF1476 domain-containing protein [Alphaproteobacteria bacterium]